MFYTCNKLIEVLRVKKLFHSMQTVCSSLSYFKYFFFRSVVLRIRPWSLDMTALNDQVSTDVNEVHYDWTCELK